MSNFCQTPVKSNIFVAVQHFSGEPSQVLAQDGRAHTLQDTDGKVSPVVELVSGTTRMVSLARTSG